MLKCGGLHMRNQFKGRPKSAARTKGSLLALLALLVGGIETEKTVCLCVCRKEEGQGAGGSGGRCSVV